MDIAINLADGVPIHRQIANQIRYMVASGILQPGEEVPSIRTLALKLKASPNTVVRAYQELEAAGVLQKRPGAGTFVAASRSPLAKQERARIIEKRIDALLAEAHQLGYAAEDLLAALRRRLAVLGRSIDSEKRDERKSG
jgi:GntR family transcriptional regulator